METQRKSVESHMMDLICGRTTLQLLFGRINLLFAIRIQLVNDSGFETELSQTESHCLCHNTIVLDLQSIHQWDLRSSDHTNFLSPSFVIMV